MSESTVTLRAVIKDEVSAQIRQIESSFVGLSAGFKSAQSSASAYTSGLKTMAEAQNSLYTSIQNEITALKAQREALQDSGYKKAAAEAAALKKEVQGMTGETQSLGQQWQSLAAKYYVASQAVGVLSSGIMSLVDASKQYEMVRARLNAAEGSTALGGQDFRDVQEMAKKPGLGFQEAATTMATLRGMKVTANEAKQLINGIAQANASAAGTAEQFGRVMYQIQQSVSTGRLMAEDLRPIMQAIPTLGAAIQEHFGASQAEALNDKLKASSKSVREFWLEVSDLGQKLPSTGETIANNIDNMGDAWVRFRAALANSDAIKGATRSMAGLLEKIAEFLEKDKDVETSYIVRTRVITRVTQDEAKQYGAAGPSIALPSGIHLQGGDSLTASIIAQGAKYKAAQDSVARMQVPSTSIWGSVAAEYDAETARAAREKEAKEKREREETEKRNKANSKEAADATKAEAKRMAAHNRASEANIETNPDGSVTLRQGAFGEDATTAEHARNREKAERADEKRADKAQKDRESKYRDDLKHFADSEKRKSDALKKELDRREAMYDKYAGQVQGLAQNQLASALRGEFSLTEARRAAFETSTNMAAQWVTESIATYVKKSLFEKEQMAVDAAAANAARAAELAASASTAAATTAAWAPAALAVTAATFGANASAGSAQYALLQTQVLGSALMPHANGGAVFGRTSASREEAFAPFVPGRIIPAHNSTTTTNHYGGANVTIHVHGGDEKTILRTLRKAGIDNRKVSRS